MADHNSPKEDNWHCTPPSGVDYDSDDWEYEESYFAGTYQPLSSLPTPPLSQGSSTASDNHTEFLLDEGETLDPTLLGAAIHLVNLLPPGASLAIPSVPLVHAILTRSRLPLDTIALAVCILDSLDHRFSLNWRLSCPLRGPEEPAAAPATSPKKRHTLPAADILKATANRLRTQLHIDSVFPEVIVLSSLVVAFKFLEDCHESTHHFATRWGRNLWTCAQINVTERCIMEGLGYRILPLWDAELIGDALADMGRAGRQHALKTPAPRGGALLPPPMSTGKAVVGLGLQLTPAETPIAEDQVLCFVSVDGGKDDTVLPCSDERTESEHAQSVGSLSAV